MLTEDIITCFNSSKVRLGDEWGDIGDVGKFYVSIPLRCDWEHRFPGGWAAWVSVSIPLRCDWERRAWYNAFRFRGFNSSKVRLGVAFIAYMLLIYRSFNSSKVRLGDWHNSKGAVTEYRFNSSKVRLGDEFLKEIGSRVVCFNSSKVRLGA